MSETESVLPGEGQGEVSAASGRDMFGNLSMHNLVLCVSLERHLISYRLLIH